MSLLIKIVILLNLVCLTSLSQAREFAITFTGKASSQWISYFQESVPSVYKFVTALAPEKTPNKSLRISFKKLAGHLGRAVLSGPIDEVQIDENLQNTTEALVVLAHELVHVIRFQYNPDEEAWLVESLAKLTEFLFTNATWNLDYEKKLKLQNLVSLNFGLDEFAPNSPQYPAAFFWVNFFTTDSVSGCCILIL